MAKTAATRPPSPTPAPTTAFLPAAALLDVALAAAPVADEAALLACATCTPKAVVVTTLAEEPEVTVVVMTEVAVVDALHPVQVVHGALVPQGPLVQPDHVDGGQALFPHQLVQGPVVHAPLD